MLQLVKFENMKPCPKCKTPWDKTEGFVVMYCAVCSCVHVRVWAFVCLYGM